MYFARVVSRAVYGRRRWSSIVTGFATVGVDYRLVCRLHAEGKTWRANRQRSTVVDASRTRGTFRWPRRAQRSACEFPHPFTHRNVRVDGNADGGRVVNLFDVRFLDGGKDEVDEEHTRWVFCRGGMIKDTSQSNIGGGRHFRWSHVSSSTFGAFEATVSKRRPTSKH